jgi:MFS family permease
VAHDQPESGRPSVAAQVIRLLLRAVSRVVGGAFRLARGEVVRRVGGPARARVITLFAVVLALNGADTATVGAVAPQLEHALHIGNARIGLLSSVSLLVGAVFTIPVGLLVDRVRRMPLLAFSIILWSLASLASALSGSYSSLLLTRLVLGAVAATAGPAIASLTGDYFPASERGRIWAYILAGEVFGTAVGFIVSGSVASVIDWRAAFVVLAIPGFYLARELWRTVPEPLRGGQSHLKPGAVDLAVAVATASARADRVGDAGVDQEPAVSPEHEAAREAARRMGAVPNPRLVLTEDPRTIGLLASVRYILRVPSNVLLIVGSSLGYFYFGGLSTFALLFVKGHFHASQAEAELILALLVAGALVGTLVGGRLTDLMVRRGRLEARIWFPAACYIGAAILLIPGFLGRHITPAVWFAVGGAALISAANPPTQAARLDIMPSGLWGRAESVRTFVRSIAQALSPLVFGGLSSLIAGIVPAQAPIGTHPKAPPSHAATGLQVSFLILLVTLAAAGFFLLKARTTYAGDVATAAASEEAIPRRRRRAPSDVAPTVVAPRSARRPSRPF